MNSPDNPKKEACFIPVLNTDCPEKCIGMLAMMHIGSNAQQDGVMVQVCPNEDRSHLGIQFTDYCGNGADVMTYHQTTVPTLEQIEFDIAEGWW